jgi:hypothetical protein
MATYPGWFGQSGGQLTLALGYLPDHLPSFMLPAAQPRDLPHRPRLLPAR